MKDATATAKECQVVSVVGDQLTTTCGNGQENCYTVAEDATITCDGKSSKTADLKAGTLIRVTPCKDDSNLARVVESGRSAYSLESKS